MTAHIHRSVHPRRHASEPALRVAFHVTAAAWVLVSGVLATVSVAWTLSMSEDVDVDVRRGTLPISRLAS